MTEIEVHNFKRLIGNWATEGIIYRTEGNLKLIGTDSYEFILDGNFILHKANVKMGNEKSETFEIITIGTAVNTANTQYYNSKGEIGCMSISFTENNFLINGDKLKFKGFINEENNRLEGKWFLQSDDKEWAEFIDIILLKIPN